MPRSRGSTSPAFRSVAVGTLLTLLVLLAVGPLPAGASAKTSHIIPDTIVGHISGTVSINYNYPIRAGACLEYPNGSAGSTCDLLMGVFSGMGTGTFDMTLEAIDNGTQTVVSSLYGFVTGNWSLVGSNPCNGTMSGLWNENMTPELTPQSVPGLNYGTVSLVNGGLYANFGLGQRDLFNVTSGSAPSTGLGSAVPQWLLTCPSYPRGYTGMHFSNDSMIGPGTNAGCSGSPCYYAVSLPLKGAGSQFSFTQASVSPPPYPPSPWMTQAHDGSLTYFDYAGAFTLIATVMNLTASPTSSVSNWENVSVIGNGTGETFESGVSVSIGGINFVPIYEYLYKWSFPASASCEVIPNYYMVNAGLAPYGNNDSADCYFEYAGVYPINVTVIDPSGMTSPMVHTLNLAITGALNLFNAFGNVQLQAAVGGAWTTIMAVPPSYKTIMQSIYPGNSLQTGANSSIRLQFPRGTSLTLGPDSYLTYLGVNPTCPVDSFLLLLARGSILNESQSVEGDECHYIETPSAMLALKGTSYTLDVLPDNSTTLRVLSGSVAITDLKTSATVTLAANQQVTVPPNGISQQALTAAVEQIGSNQATSSIPPVVGFAFLAAFVLLVVGVIAQASRRRRRRSKKR